MICTITERTTIKQTHGKSEQTLIQQRERRSEAADEADQVQQLTRWINNPLLALQGQPDGSRSPSPEPVYDQYGVRSNTREQRLKAKFTKERQDLIETLIKTHPGYKRNNNNKHQRKYEMEGENTNAHVVWFLLLL